MDIGNRASKTNINSVAFDKRTAYVHRCPRAVCLGVCLSICPCVNHLVCLFSRHPFHSISFSFMHINSIEFPQKCSPLGATGEFVISINLHIQIHPVKLQLILPQLSRSWLAGDWQMEKAISKMDGLFALSQPSNSNAIHFLI